MPWVKTICNHLYYSAMTCDGNVELLRDKWLSCVNHVVNIHVFNYPTLTQCEHGPLDSDGDSDDEQSWLKQDSDAHKALNKVVNDPRLLKDFGKLTDFCLTGDLESYHSMLLSYCPKRVFYPYTGMQARLTLAALDYNHNVDRSQVTDSAGNPIVRQVFSKARKEWVLRNVYKGKEYSYLNEIVHKVVERREDPSIRMGDPDSFVALPELLELKPSRATKDKPSLEYAIDHRFTRFPDKKL